MPVSFALLLRSVERPDFRGNYQDELSRSRTNGHSYVAVRQRTTRPSNSRYRKGIRALKTYVTTTATRPYLFRTLESLKEAGFDDVELVYDHNQDGPFRCFKKALRNWVERERTLSPAMFCQDDVVFSKRLAKYLESLPWSAGQWELHSVYTAGTYARDDVKGWFPLPNDARLYGACALIISPGMAENFLRDNPRGEMANMTDTIFGEWCRENNVPIYLHSPSLAQHIGEKSTLHEFPITEHRRAVDFVDDISDMLPETITTTREGSHVERHSDNSELEQTS